MTSRLSYASSPESDLETGPESRSPSKSSSLTPTNTDSRSRLIKSSSDPSIAALEPQTAPANFESNSPRVVSIYDLYYFDGKIKALLLYSKQIITKLKNYYFSNLYMFCTLYCFFFNVAHI